MQKHQRDEDKINRLIESADMNIPDSVTIDLELKKATSLSWQEGEAVEKFVFAPSEEMSQQEIKSLRSAILRIFIAVRGFIDYKHNVKRKRGDLIGIFVIFFIIISVLAIDKFRGNQITVDVIDESVYAIESTWWGLSKKYIEIKWMQAKGYDAPGWMARDKNNQWYLYIWDYNGF